MGSLERRVRALEVGTDSQAKPGYKIPRRVERYTHILENARRRSQGLEPLPDLPYTKEDYEDDLETLEYAIPALRDDAGWQTEEAQAWLDAWEQNLKDKLYGKD